MNFFKGFVGRLLSVNVALSLIFTQALPTTAIAQVLNLSAPNAMIFSTSSFSPVLMKGITLHPDNPLVFDFIFDSGNSGLAIASPEFKAESQRLIKYFLTALTIKEDDLWVNLSPYERSRMLAEELEKTQLGQDMLAQDYILKQLTSSLMYPEKDLGKSFWENVYARAQKEYGTTDVPLSTLNKVWIVADKAKVLERQNTAYVVGTHLRVMLEEDYLALNKQGAANQSHAFTSDIVRKIIVPEIEKEVNQGQHFAPLRQMYYSMILASWYKMSVKNALLNQVYTNKNKTGGVLSRDPSVNQKIYEQYLQAFKNGVFNYVKEETDAVSQEVVPRKYISGGMAIQVNKAMTVTTQAQSTDELAPIGSLATATVRVVGSSPVMAQSAKPRIIIFETKGWDTELIQQLYGEYDIVMEEGPLTADYMDQHAGQLANVQAINIFLGSKMDEEMINRLTKESPALKVIATRTAGTDHVNFSTAAKHGIKVVNVPDYGSQAIAEHAVAMMLSLTAQQSPHKGQGGMTKIEYGLTRLFAIAKKLDETKARVQQHQFARSGIKGMNFLDDANPKMVYFLGQRDSLSLDTVHDLGMMDTMDISKADILWGDIREIKPEQQGLLKKKAILINMGRPVTTYQQAFLGNKQIIVATIPDNPLGLSVRGLTMGVVGGAGKIGQHTIRLAKALGMKVNVFDVDMTSSDALKLKEVVGFEYRPMDQLLMTSDVISLHVPLNDKTKHLISRPQIGLMKRGAILLNTARGPVVDTSAVIDALASGQLSAAGLDVVEGDPGIFPQNGQAPSASEAEMQNLQALLNNDHVIITPHNAYNTTASEYQMLNITQDRIAEVVLVNDLSASSSVDKPQAPGGIDLNAKNMVMDITKDAGGIDIKLDPAMIAEFQAGHFTGVQGVILKIAPIQTPLF